MRMMNPLWSTKRNNAIPTRPSAPPYTSFMKLISRSALAAALLISPIAATLTVPAAFAQANAPRVVSGKVLDGAGAPLKAAVVYLKDTHTLAIKSAIAAEDGAYRFGQLSQNTDYEIWAESSGKKSGTKTISSFDSKNSFTINFKL